MALEIAKISSSEIKALAQQADADKNGIIEGEEKKVFDGLLKEAVKTNPLAADYRKALGFEKTNIQSNQTDVSQTAAVSVKSENTTDKIMLKPVDTIDEIMFKPIDKISSIDIQKIAEEINKKEYELGETNEKIKNIQKTTLRIGTGGGLLTGAIWGARAGGILGLIVGGTVGALTGFMASLGAGFFTLYSANQKAVELKNDLQQLFKKVKEIEMYKSKFGTGFNTIIQI